MALTTSSWDNTGYQQPIVLALLPVVITSLSDTAADITEDPVVISSGELDVASDLMVVQVERHNNVKGSDYVKQVPQISISILIMKEHLNILMPSYL